MGSAWSNPGGVTTQAWPQSGRYARTATARRRLVDLLRTEQLEWVLLPAFNQPADLFQGYRGLHANFA